MTCVCLCASGTVPLQVPLNQCDLTSRVRNKKLVPLSTEDKLLLDRFYDATKQEIPSNVSIPDFKHTRTLVVGARARNEVAWVVDELPGLETVIYSIDNEDAPFHIPKNKGHEAMVYLTYIIDHYDNLPDVVLFFHPHRFSWHNNLLLNLDSAQMIHRLSSDRVMRHGYMNARCHPDPGCPIRLHIDREEQDIEIRNKPKERNFKPSIWHDLFGADTPVPEELSQSCCAQFAASRDAIHRHPIEQYMKWRDWLLDTPLDDHAAAHIFEYTWQYIFTGEPELCPSMDACYCDGYGVCFGSDERVDMWLQSRDAQGALERRLIAIEEGRDKGGFLAQLKAKKGSMDLQDYLERERVEAFQRGQDLEERRNASAREELDVTRRR
ncbi:hypothetical protein NA57DRAFT_54157 [Rhizodiscina lignyota]|uniref:Uncharacterized protein n=1 Tax=Rhizodiscina lignyota TaxID=1504668 RepID=A0A9P4M910_9PEZI|nr:hypothetical protein NA57DRAFT_54157 [Rhizodiscina lignyota]